MWHGFGCGAWGWGGGAGGFGVLLMIVFLLALVGLAIFGITRTGRGTYSPGAGDALVIARERYARGEISEKEFEQIKKSL